ncbi:hypothetical protein RND71_007059 [Anisodus tanguticus]|uniref:Uncharacterized protein n=1 Tax=Anisodus tanguticus TaxID=243964 RepID=A0AAE1SL49_9SOLA|nr:hypothetical protein RND71_007059 [Anisodus tanguticus]
MILQTTTNSFTFSSQPISRTNFFFKNLTFFTSPLLPKSFLPSLDYKFYLGNKRSSFSVGSVKIGTTNIHATLLEAPVLWAGRVCVFYALLKAGLAGSPSNPLVSDLETDGNADLGFAKWFEELQSKPEKEATDRRKLVSKWHPTTKGTLRRNYRVPSKPEGRRLLKSIASLHQMMITLEMPLLTRVVRLGGRVLTGKVSVATTCGHCLMSSQHHILSSRSPHSRLVL